MREFEARLRAMETAGAALLKDEPMSRHTTFRLGGKADWFFCPSDDRQIAEALRAARDFGVPALVIGNGSNLIVRDGGVRGLVVALGERMANIAIDGAVLTAQAGASLARVASEAQVRGLAGLEFASGIPGSLGGGVAMNAGAYGGQLSDVLLRATVLTGGELREFSTDALELGYRTSMPLKTGAVVTRAEFLLTPDAPDAIFERMKTLNAKRREKQPLNLPSAGSVFKRPEGYFAGALIEGAGLKGLRVGGAMVSEKHAGFIVNAGGATARDVLDLIARVQAVVNEQSGVLLEPEVRIVGED